MYDSRNNILQYENMTTIQIFSTHEKVKSYTRSAYNGLDLLGDIGGLYDGLKLLFSAVLTALSGIDFTSLLISKLFFVDNIKTNQSKDINNVC